MTQVSRTSFKTNTNSLYPDNTTGQISPSDLRVQMDNIADSTAFKGTGKTTAPTANDDSANTSTTGAFNVGDIWIDETANKSYICVDDTPTAAIWLETGSGGNVSKVGTPVNNQVGVWTGDGTIEGDTNLIWTGSNFGINVNSPTAELHINQGGTYSPSWSYVSTTTIAVESTTDNFINIASGNTNIGGILFSDLAADGPGKITYDHNTNQLDIVTNSLVRLTVDSGGKVHIGGSGGSGLLNVYNGKVRAISSGGTGYGDFTAALGSGGAKIEAYSGSASTGTFIDFDGATSITSGTIDVRFFRSTNTSGTSQITIYNGDGTGVWQHRLTQGSCYLSTQSSGKVIIGSNVSPTATLDVRDMNSAASNKPLQRWFTDQTVQSSLYLYSPAANTGISPFTFDTTNALRFQIDSNDVLALTDTGNVGIKTTAASVALEVNSTDAIKVPIGADVDRPVAAAGLIRFNTTSNRFEGYTATWDIFGDVAKVGTPVNNQIGVWTGDGTIEGSAGLTWDGTTLTATTVTTDLTVNAQTGTAYTLALADRNGLITMNNAAANTVTIPANATTAFSVGATIRIIQLGAGVTSITGATGVTVNGVLAGTGAIVAQYDDVRLYKIATDTWVISGSIGTVA